VIVSFAEGQLRVRIFNAGPDRRGDAEIQRRALDIQDLPGRDQPLIHGRDAVRLDHQLMPRIVFVKSPDRLKYECCVGFRMVGRSVAPSYSMRNSLASVSFIPDFQRHRPGILFLPIPADILQLERRIAGSGGIGIPQDLLNPVFPPWR